MKLPISAMVVAKNEAELLKDCLPKLTFCDEIIVIDLNSIDDTIEVAKKNNAKVLKSGDAPFAEFVLKRHFSEAKHDWVLITDPDEIISKVLEKEIISLYNKKLKLKSCAIGVVNAPIFFYFNKRKLKGTSWGGLKYRHYLVHKERFYFEEKVHSGRKLKDGYGNFYIKFKKDNFIKHFWLDSYSQFVEKHKRYLHYEGKTRYENGNRTSILKILIEPINQFYSCFFLSRGFKDGIVGLNLSVLRSWYFTVALIKLYKYQNKNG